MLTFKQYLELVEGLSPIQKSAISSWVPDTEKIKSGDDWTTKNAVRLSSHIIPEGENHVIIPFVNFPEDDHPDVKTVRRHLERHGYTNINPASGFAIDSENRRQRISTALRDTNADQTIIHKFNQANKQLKDISDTHYILLSRAANDIAGCGTNKKYPSSCITLDDNATLDPTQTAARNKLPSELAAGTHVAFLIPKKFQHLTKEEQIDNAVSRILLKPHQSEYGHEILYPENKVYSHKNIAGTKVESRFRYSLNNYAEEHFPMEDLRYTKHPDVYDDDGESVRHNTNVSFAKLRNKFIQSLRTGEFRIKDMDYAHEHKFYDREVENASKEGLIKKLRSGKFEELMDHLYHAENNGYLDEDVHNASAHGLLNNLRDPERKVDVRHLQHAENNEYFNDELMRASKERLMSDLREGRYDFSPSRSGNHIQHAIRNEYYDSEVKQAAKEGIISQLRSGVKDIYAINHSKTGGYYDTDIEKAINEFDSRGGK